MADTDEAARAHLRFALALHASVAGNGRDSCVSPYSIASALGLVSQGARGQVADEVARLIGGGQPDIAAQRELLTAAATLSAPQASEPPMLAVSNTLWAWDGLPIQSGFRDELAGWPGGAVAQAPFVDHPDRARRTINEDVAHTTRGLIPQLLAPGSVRADTVASLVNALYLRAGWSCPFPAHNTRDQDFHAPDGVRRVAMMHQYERLAYAARAGWELVELPAAGGTQASILLPNGDLAGQESTLDAALLADLLSGAQQRMVRLWLPRFRLDLPTELTEPLTALGAGTMFSPDADFGPITTDPRLRISDVLHQSVLRVDEQGLEGAAATAAMMQLVSMPTSDPVRVRVDRPFLVLIRHVATGAIYFFGRITRP